MFRRSRTPGRALLALAAALAAGGCARATPPSALPAGSASRWFGDVTPPQGQVFSYNNGAEPETIDPALMSGQPDGRVARIMFEGLTVPDPHTLQPRPGQAYRWDEGADGRTWTFHLRPGLVWSDGTPLTAHDFRWAWLRVLAPETTARYANIFYMIRGAAAYKEGRGGRDAVGIAAPDDSTFVVTLESPTAYFLFLSGFYPFLPTPRATIKRWGDQWTRPEHVISNGPFLLEKWRPQDRFEFAANPRYWDRDHVRLKRVVAYSVEDLNTATNLYKAGVIDWLPSGQIPSPFVPHMRAFADYRHAPYQGTYYYSINVTRPPFDNVWVRRALSYAVNREAIADELLKGSREPWGDFTPSGYPGYRHPPGVTFDPGKARGALALAGYPDGKGFPKISILFNTSEDHRRIAEAIQAMWKRVLRIDVELSNQEWGSFLQATTALQYDVARRSWIGDYLDPNTFLATMVTGDGNNRTGWSNARYDSLVAAASHEADPARRFAMLREAEAIVLDQAPVIPIYQYSTNEMVKPYVRGLYPNALDTHPLKDVWIDHDWAREPGAVAGR